jgi:hypothetical protein
LPCYVDPTRQDEPDIQPITQTQAIWTIFLWCSGEHGLYNMYIPGKKEEHCTRSEYNALLSTIWQGVERGDSVVYMFASRPFLCYRTTIAVSSNGSKKKLKLRPASRRAWHE